MALLRVGFTEPSRSPGMLVRSYRTVSPLPPPPKISGVVAVCSLWHCPASRLGLPLAITLLCEVRTFLDPLSPARRGRPANSSAPSGYCAAPVFRERPTRLTETVRETLSVPHARMPAKP